MLLEYCSKCGTKVDDESLKWGAVRVDADTYLCPDCARAGGVQSPARSSNSRTPAIPARSSNSAMPGVGGPRSSNSRTPAVQPRAAHTPPHGAKTGAHAEKTERPAAAKSSGVPVLLILICLGAAASGVAILYGNPFQQKPVEQKPADSGRSSDTPQKSDTPPVEEDPRERIANNYLSEAKALIAADQKNLKAYQQKLMDLKSKYGFTAAGREAELLLQDPMFSAKTPDDLPTDPEWEKAVDVLAAVDLNIDALRGIWEKSAKGITVKPEVKHDLSTLLALPYVPPLEYDVRIKFTRKVGNDTLALLMPRGAYGAAFMPSGYQGKYSGFERVNGKRINDNPTTFKGSVFKTNQEQTMIILVRERILKGYVDGQLISTCVAKPEELSLAADDWTTPFLNRLNIGSWQNTYEIHSIKVIERTGKGKLLASPDRNRELQQGLWAGYFKNEDKRTFSRFHMGRAEKKLGFDIKDGKIDPEMSPDKFSVRYAGLLRVDVPGTYKFSYNADDRIEVWLDGKSLGMREFQAWQKIDVELTAGDHPIRIDFTEIGGNAAMRFLCIRPGDTVARSIPEDFLWYDPAKIEFYQNPAAAEAPSK